MKTIRASEGWAVYEVEDGCRHVVPVNDRRWHVMSMGCWCAPWLEPHDPMIVVHEAEDGRE